MTDTQSLGAKVRVSLQRRYRAERRFKLYGLLAILFALSALLLLFTSIFVRGFSAFTQSEIRLDLNLSPQILGINPTSQRAELMRANYAAVIKKSLYKRFPQVTDRRSKRKLYGLLSRNSSFELAQLVTANPQLIGQQISLWVATADNVDLLLKKQIDREKPQTERKISDQEIKWIDELQKSGDIKRKFNSRFFTQGDSREPEQAGILGALVGTLLTLSITLLLSLPIGLGSAIYLEEFAPKNKITDFIEVNINNLAAVPSVIFGLLGLSILLNQFGMPRSAPVVGGIVLMFMTLPTIIIASRTAINTVPPSIREAALGLGASKIQALFHHVIPLAMPGILTGSIIGMSRALGETAPLLMIGMVAFIVDIPAGFLDPATVLPVQIFIWADSPERAFMERTAAAIIILLIFMILINLSAVILRRKFERNW